MQRRIGNALVSVGLLVLAMGVVANGAFATDDLDKYQDKVNKIEGSRSYDSGANTTTFTFVLDVQEDVSHLLVIACPETNATNATAPSGVKIEMNQKDGSTDHTGTKFTPGKDGTYTVTYSGNITGAQYIVKNGDGHKHFYIGSGTGCEGTPVTTSSSSTTATTAGSTTTTTAAETTTTTAAETTTTTAAETTTTTAAETTTTTAAEESTTTTEPESTTTTLLPEILPTSTTATTVPESSSSSSSSTTATTAPSTTTTDATVLGQQQTNPSNGGTGVQSDVLGSQIEQGAPAANIPNTGADVGSYLILAGLAILLGGLAVRFGQVEPAQG